MLRPNFIKQKIAIETFGKTRFWVGVIIGVIIALVFFFFFSLTKLSMHHLTYMGLNGFSISPPKETYFYQYLFAFSSLLIGQHFFMEFTFSRVRSFRKRNIKKINIVQNSRFITWGILHTSFKWATSLGFLSLTNAFAVFNSYGIAWWISILLLIWWHFSTWQAHSIFLKNVFKVSCLTFIFFALLSFGITSFSPTLISKGYRIRAEQLPHYQLQIDIPTASPNVSNHLKYRSLVRNIFIGDPEKDNIPNLLSEYGEKINLNDIKTFVDDFNAMIPESLRHRIIVSLAIDKQIKMRHVYEVLDELRKNDQLILSLATLHEEQKDHEVFYEHFQNGILFKLPPSCEQIKKRTTKNNSATPLKKENFDCLNFRAIYESEFAIKINADNTFKINNEITSSSNLFIKIKNHISDKGDHAIITLDIHPESTYQNYFLIRHEIKRVFVEVRNEKALKLFGVEFNALSKEKQTKIRTIYPMIIGELINEEERIIYNSFNKK